MEISSARSKFSVLGLLRRTQSTFFISFVIASFYTACAGSLITFDGRQYLATTHAIQTHNFANGYLFGRPPLYPVFLAALLSVSRSDRFLIFAQVFLIAITSLMLMNKILQFSKSRSIKISIPWWVRLILLVSPTITGYGSTVLQQTLFIVETNLMLLFLLTFLEGDNKKKNISYIFSLILVPITILTGQGMTPFVIGVGLLFSLFLLTDSQGKFKITIANLSLTVILLSAIPVSFVAYSQYEKWGLSKSDSVNYPVPSGSALSKYPKYFLGNPEQAAGDLFDDYVTQSGLAPAMQSKGLINPDHIITPAFYENRVHSENTFSMARSCGIADTNSAGGWYMFSVDMLTQNCAKIILPSFIGLLFFGIGAILSFASFVFIPISVLILLRSVRKRRIDDVRAICVLAFPSALVKGAYLLMGFQPDRYVVQTLIPAVITLLWLIQLHLSKD